MIHRFANSVVVQWGWRRHLIAVTAGAVSALSMPPYDAAPLLFVTFPVLIWLIDGSVAAGKRRAIRAALSAFAVGWSFGFGYFLAGLYWIGSAFLVEAETFGWLMPFAIVALPAGLALFYGLMAFVARLLWAPGPWRVLPFAVALAAVELIRGTVLTGFPWNGFGYALTVTPVLMQSASLVSVYGLALAAGLIFSAPAALAPSTGGWRRWAPVGLAAALVVSIVVFGIVRLGAPPRPGTGIIVRIVQPSIPQAEKWKPENRSAIFNRFLELSDQATSPETMGARDVSLIVWPESAIPFLYQTSLEAQALVDELLPPGGALITGLQRTEPAETEERGLRVYNSIAIIDDTGAIVDAYDKVHLVPFGEYLPFQDLLEALGLRQLTGVSGGFAAGSERGVLSPATAPAFLPLICYEVIFPGQITPHGERPHWLLNVTNDAWFGDSAGPYQHLRQARVRAIEEGLPLVRAANTGVSAMIDPYGRITASLALNTEGILDGELSASLPQRPFASQYGLWIPIVLVVVGFGLSMVRRLRIKA